MRTFKGYSTVGKTHGNFKLYDIERVKRDLLNEFYTRKGERLMAPEFGSIVWDLLFDPMTPDIVEIIKTDSERIVNRDPRLEHLRTDVSESEHTITVAIQLRFRPTSTVEELVAVYRRDIAAEVEA